MRHLLAVVAICLAIVVSAEARAEVADSSLAGFRIREVDSSRVALTRFRGHHPKGGYDVPHGQDRGAPATAQVHG